MQWQKLRGIMRKEQGRNQLRNASNAVINTFGNKFIGAWTLPMVVRVEKVKKNQKNRRISSNFFLVYEKLFKLLVKVKTCAGKQRFKR